MYSNFQKKEKESKCKSRAYLLEQIMLNVVIDV